jgi:hypothetical protein
MVIASLNGTYAQGFLEVIERSDGSIERTGLLKFSAPSAIELRRLFDARVPLTYFGPVFADGRWHCDTFPITATDIAWEAGSDETLNVTVRAASSNGHAR